MIPPDVPLDHCRRNRSAQIGEGGDVEVDHLSLALRIEFGKAPDEAEAGVVDEEIDDLSIRLKVGHQLRRGVRLRKIERHGASLSKLLCKFLEPLFAARDEDDRMAALRQLARKLNPESRRRAGDERDLLHSAGLADGRLDDLSRLARRLADGKRIDIFHAVLDLAPNRVLPIEEG